MKKLSLYIVMLGIFFLGILSFSNNVFSSTLLTLGTGDTICSSIYAPVCGVLNTELCYDSIGGTGGGCKTVPYYKTFGNECELGANTDGFVLFKNGECEVQKNITVTAPTSVEKGSTFTYSWNAVGGYEYCMPTGSIGADMASSGNGRLSLTGSVTISAPAITSTLTSLTVGVQCYYKDLRGFYMSDTKTATVKLTSPSICSSIYVPVCGVTYLEACTSTNCTKTPVYKTFSNKCVLDANNEGYSFYKEGECEEVKKSITVTAPTSVVIGTIFTYSWKAEGGYEYCKTTGIIEGNTASSGNGNLSIAGLVTVTAPSTSNSTSMIVGIQCYYKDLRGFYMSDTKTATVKLTTPSICNDIYAPVCGVTYLEACTSTNCTKTPVYKTFSNTCLLSKNNEGYSFYKEGECSTENQCIVLGGRGPNGSLGTNDPNKDKKCCAGLTLVTPPSCNYIDERTGLTVTKDGCGTICANIGDGVCESYYENSLNSKDCISTKNIIIEAPTNVTKGTTFTYSWNATGGYEYCIPKMNGSDFPSSGSGNLGIKGSLRVAAPAIGSSLTSMTVGVQCYYKESNSNVYKIDAKHTPITLINTEVCNSTSGEVCGVKFLQSCSQGGTSSSTCKVIPIYKLFSNQCELNKNISGYTFYKNGKCDNIVDDTVKLTNSVKIKLDKSIKKLLEKIDQSYNNKTDKINAINVIIDKLLVVQTNKPKYINITKYVIERLNEEIVKINSEEDINIDEIINIFN